MADLLNGSLPVAGEERRAEYVAMSFLVRYSNRLTRDGYGRSLRQWFTWLYSHGVDPLDAKRVHIEAWCRSLEIGGNQKTTVGTKLHALAGFYRFAFIDGVIDADPMLHIARPQIQRQSTTNALRRSELWDLVKAAERHSPRAHALICVLGFNGLRISEALGIDIEHLGFDHGYRTIFVQRRKNDLHQVIPLSQITAWAIDSYLDGRGTGPLFITSSGRRLIRQGAARLLRQLLDEVGIDRRITPHSLRHSFCTLSHDAGVSSRNIQHSGGWADERMVAYYDHGGDKYHQHATHSLTAFVAGVE